jgi:hypothetical protein
MVSLNPTLLHSRIKKKCGDLKQFLFCQTSRSPGFQAISAPGELSNLEYQPKRLTTYAPAGKP